MENLSQDIMFIHENLSESLKDMFFGPIEVFEKVETFSDRETMAHLIARAGLFPSPTQAAKNGWGKPIPAGFTVTQHKKKKRDIFILNRFDGCDDS